MKNLYLHVGLSKTGSSALQSWLSLNASVLAQQGYYYADLVPSAKEGKITAGNGVALFNACKSEDSVEVERLIADVYFGSYKKAIISSGALQNIPLESISKIKEICDRNKVKVTVLAYVRSAYELFYSNYLQGVKRHGFDYKFGQKGGFSYSMQTKFLKNYLSVFKESLIVNNYDFVKNDIFISFANSCGFNSKLTSIKNKTVNRSLTHNEAEVLRKANAIHRGLFSAEISNYLIDKTPEKKTVVYYKEELINKVINNCIDDISWINEQFFIGKKSLDICLYDKALTPINESNDTVNDVYKIIVEWCLDSPKSSKENDFVEFIRDLGVSIEKNNLDLAYVLMRKAHKLRPNGPFIKNRLAIYEKRLNQI